MSEYPSDERGNKSDAREATRVRRSEKKIRDKEMMEKKKLIQARAEERRLRRLANRLIDGNDRKEA